MWAYFRAITLVGLIVATPLRALVERRDEQRFAVSGPAALKVDVVSGSVRITEDPSAKAITVVVYKSADVETEAEMDTRLSRLKLRVAENRGAVAVHAARARSFGWDWETWPPVALVFEITVPRRCDVDVRVVDGGVVVGNVEGRVRVESEAGKIFTGEIHGAVTARSQAGAVAVTAASGPVDVSTVTGNIIVGRAAGTLRAESRGGFIEVQRASGKVRVRGDGSSAQIGFVSTLDAPADIALTGGELALVLENNMACTLDARSSVLGRVGVRGELPLTVLAGAAGSSRLAADVNGGGPRIVARVRGGSVLVRGVEPLLNPTGEAAEAAELASR